MDTKRFFWDSKLAIWLEDTLNKVTNWFVDKRYPTTDWNESFYKQPQQMPPVRDVLPDISVEEVAAPKPKKARKKRAKKNT